MAAGGESGVEQRMCVYCDSEGNVELACKQHKLCQKCLPKNMKQFGYTEDQMFTCPKCTKPTVQSSHVWIFADNSNIWIEAMKHAAEVKKFVSKQDHRVRIDYERLRDIVARNRESMATLYGSVPPPVDTFWERVKRSNWEVKTKERSGVTGKEKEVDAQMVADVTEVVCKTSPHLRGTIIIISGDRDMRPAVEKSLENGWKVEMYIWKNAHSLQTYLNAYNRSYPGCVSYLFLDEIEKKVTFLNRELSENPQDDINNCSVLITLKEGLSPEKIIDNKKWWNALESVSQWPVEYRNVQEQESVSHRHLLLVFQHMEGEEVMKLVKKINLPNVEKCELFSKSRRKGGCIQEEDDYLKIVRGIKLQKSGAAATNTAKSSATTQAKTQTSKPTNCCSGKNCDSGLECRFDHTEEEKIYFKGRGGTGNVLRKTQQCKFYPNCKSSDCKFAHDKDDRRCVKCHKTGHFSIDCKNYACSHLRHSQSS